VGDTIFIGADGRSDVMPTRVGAREAHALTEKEGYVQVDVRSIAEFEAGHPAGSRNIPWMHIDTRGRALNPDFVEVFERTFPDKASKVVLTCLSGNRSMQALSALEARGYGSLVDQRAGWGGVRDAFGRVTDEGWSQASLPAETGAGGERSYEALSKR
jgi:rhodanese-related sulfurtransferase